MQAEMLEVQIQPRPVTGLAVLWPPQGQWTEADYTLPDRYPSIRFSTLVLAPPGLDTASLTGLVTFNDDFVLCVYELLNFQRWHPHPPHHKHVPPDIKHHRLPASGLSFTQPNLPVLMAEIERDMLSG